jgi:hypothetical protein
MDGDREGRERLSVGREMVTDSESEAVLVGTFEGEADTDPDTCCVIDTDADAVLLSVWSTVFDALAERLPVISCVRVLLSETSEESDAVRLHEALTEVDLDPVRDSDSASVAEIDLVAVGESVRECTGEGDLDVEGVSVPTVRDRLADGVRLRDGDEESEIDGVLLSVGSGDVDRDSESDRV